MRFVKLALIIMGVFIVAGYGYLGVEVFRRLKARGAGVEPTPAVEVVALDLPPGTRLEEVVAIAGRVAFVARVPNGADRLYLLDPRTSSVVLVVTAGKVAAPEATR